MSDATPRRRVILVATVVTGVILVGLVALLAGRSSAPATKVDGPLVGTVAPAVRGTTLEGATVDLTSLRGRPVVLNFVASWCGPCRTEAPHLEAFAYDQSKVARGAAVIGVAFNDATSAMRRYAAAQGVTYPILTDPGGSIASAWGVASPPTTFVISPSGKVSAELVGAVSVQDLAEAVAPFADPVRADG